VLDLTLHHTPTESAERGACSVAKACTVLVQVLTEELEPLIVVDVTTVVMVNVAEQGVHVRWEYTKVEVKRPLELVKRHKTIPIGVEGAESSMEILELILDLMLQLLEKIIVCAYIFLC